MPANHTLRDAEFVDVSEMRVHFRRSGKGHPLVLVHGLVGSSLNWHRNVESLSTTSDVIAIDLPNMGRSQRLPGLDPGLEATADRLAAIVTRLGISRADFAGHSHGGAIAMMLAARHPRMVRTLILFAPVNPFCHLAQPLIRFYSTRAGAWLARLVPALPRKLKAISLRRMYGDPIRIVEGALDGYIGDLHVPGTIDHILAILQRWPADMEDLRKALPSLSEVPTLLVWGDRDPAVGLASAADLHRALPESRLIVLPGVGHIPFEELPQDCNAILRDWFIFAESAHNRAKLPSRAQDQTPSAAVPSPTGP